MDMDTRESLRCVSGKSIFYPIGSMYGIFTIFTYIWLIFMVNVGKYTIHGSYGYGISNVEHYSPKNTW